MIWRDIKVKGGGLSVHLSTGIWATSPVHSDCLWDVQLFFQLLGNGCCPVLGFNDGHTAELGASAAHKPSGERLGVQAVLLEEGLFLHVGSHFLPLPWVLNYNALAMYWGTEFNMHPSRVILQEKSAIRLKRFRGLK